MHLIHFALVSNMDLMHNSDMTNYKLDGRKLKIALNNSLMTREKVIVEVQDLIRPQGLSFSFAGLSKMLEGELPKRDGEIILEAVANVLGKEASDFAESEALSA
jgi:hypothetical protein